MTRDTQTNARANAEVLLWQARVRLAVAVATGGGAFALERMGWLEGGGRGLAVVIGVYVGAVGGMV